MTLLLTRYVTAVLIIVTVPLTLSISCPPLPLLAPLATLTVTLCALCFCRLIEKTTPLYIAPDQAALAPSLGKIEGHVSVTKQLIEARCYIDLQDKNGGTPLFIAAHHGQAVVAQLLLAARCNIDLQTKSGLQAAQRAGHRFVAASRVERAQHNQEQFHFRRAAFHSQLKSKVATSSPRPRPCESTLTSMAPLSLHAHTHTPSTHKPLASSQLTTSLST
jgi:hypothetical protein